MKWMGKLSSAKNRCNHSITNTVSSSAGRWRINCYCINCRRFVEAAEANVVIYVISILGIATIIGIFRGYNVEVETGKVSLRLKAGA